jgi:hypothetical protein
MVPSLKVIREDGSIPLTLENQGVSFAEVKEGLTVAKITDLPIPGDKEGRLKEGVNRASEGGESPPEVRIWHLPAHVVSANAVATRCGNEWISRKGKNRLSDRLSPFERRRGRRHLVACRSISAAWSRQKERW